MKNIQDVETSCWSLTTCPYFTFGVLQWGRLFQVGQLASMDTSKCPGVWLLVLPTHHHFTLKEKGEMNQEKGNSHLLSKCWLPDMTWALSYIFYYFFLSILFSFIVGRELCLTYKKWH